MKNFKLKFLIITILLLVATFSINPLKTDTKGSVNSNILYATGYNPTDEEIDCELVKKVVLTDTTESSLSSSYSIIEELTNRMNNETDTAIKAEIQTYINNFIGHQQNYGLCYTFAPLTMLESNIALTHNAYYDFSEIHMATASYVEDGYTSSNDNNTDFNDLGGNIK